MIDFEQLKIENQTYNEKIEERNEDLAKLGNKIESAVQVLTHMKEKLDFLTEQNVNDQCRKIVHQTAGVFLDIIIMTFQGKRSHFFQYS